MLGKFLMILPQKSCATLFFFTYRQVYSGIGAAASFTAWRCSLNFGTFFRFKIIENILRDLTIEIKLFFSNDELVNITAGNDNVKTCVIIQCVSSDDRRLHLGVYTRRFQ